MLVSGNKCRLRMRLLSSARRSWLLAGVFLSVSITAQRRLSASLAPSSVPPQQPTADSCSYTVLACDSNVTGSNTGLTSFVEGTRQATYGICLWCRIQTRESQLPLAYQTVNWPHRCVSTMAARVKAPVSLWPTQPMNFTARIWFLTRRSVGLIG